MEIALLPVVVAFVGIGGSLIISKSEQEHAKKLAAAQTVAAQESAKADREIAVLEMFSEKITGEPEEQALALNILGALDSNLHAKLSAAVGDSTTDAELAQLASRQEFQASQRIEAEARQRTEDENKNRKQDKQAASVIANQQAQDSAGSYCDDLMKSFDANKWRENYLKNTEIGTWHVFVASLTAGASVADADSLVAKYRSDYPRLSFDRMSTVSADNVANARHAIVIASGLTDKNTAFEIAKQADRCVAKGAYPYQQKI